MKKTGIRPGIRIAFDSPLSGEGYREVFPLRKSWVAILIILALDIAFSLPAWFTAGQALDAWTRMSGLFDLVIAVFLSAWLLGWIIAPLSLTLILVVLLFGREVVKAWRSESGGRVEAFLGLPLIGIAVRYDAAVMRNLRWVEPEKKSGTSWRGPHIEFDYGSNTDQFGSGIEETDLPRIKSEIEIATGQLFRRGEARPEELVSDVRPEPRGRLAAMLKARERSMQARKAAAEPSAPMAAREPLVAESTVVPAGVIEPISLASPSTLLLIVANLVPLFGTLAWGWDLSNVMVLYWAESAVIGFFNILKLIVIGGWASVVSVPFFLGHFGGFMAVHFLFIYSFFVTGPQSGEINDDLVDVVALFFALWPALLMLFISHAYSFHRNFLGRGEFRGRSINQQMTEPYGRIIFMHIAIIVGGGLSLMLGGPTLVLIALIGFKIFFDVRAHLKEHEA